MAEIEPIDLTGPCPCHEQFTSNQFFHHKRTRTHQQCRISVAACHFEPTHRSWNQALQRFPQPFEHEQAPKLGSNINKPTLELMIFRCFASSYSTSANPVWILHLHIIFGIFGQPVEVATALLSRYPERLQCTARVAATTSTETSSSKCLNPRATSVTISKSSWISPTGHSKVAIRYIRNNKQSLISGERDGVNSSKTTGWWLFSAPGSQQPWQSRAITTSRINSRVVCSHEVREMRTNLL